MDRFHILAFVMGVLVGIALHDDHHDDYSAPVITVVPPPPLAEEARGGSRGRRHPHRSRGL
jgi:hypothetical protein